MMSVAMAATAMASETGAIAPASRPASATGVKLRAVIAVKCKAQMPSVSSPAASAFSFSERPRSATANAPALNIGPTISEAAT